MATIIRWIVLPLFTALLAVSAAAEESDVSPADAPPDGPAQERLAEIRERLDLSDEQAELAEPILRQGLEAQAAVLEKHGIGADGRDRGRPSLREARKLRKVRGELDKVRESTRSELAAVLTDEQIEELAQIQEEGRQAFRERMGQRR